MRSRCSVLKGILFHVMLRMLKSSGWLLKSSTFQRYSQSRSLLMERRTIWQAGDMVYFNENRTKGVIEEHRGSGWYTMQLLDQNGIGKESIKVRGTRLSLVPKPMQGDSSFSHLGGFSTETPSFRSNPEPVNFPMPKIIDLDSQSHVSGSASTSMEKEYLHQVDFFRTIDRWIVFTDLHCAPSTMGATIATLDAVHASAVQQNAGILFLGDFWHHRGTLRVDCLNIVLEKLSTWTVPMVMIPGNHDQVTLDGMVHGLTPLLHAYRVDTGGGTTCPGPLVFTTPTVFKNALFVPHIRESAVLESVLRSPYSTHATALFVHADITGAYMNDLIVSREGVSPSAFPSGVPIYSGHFHKPHVVQKSGVSVEYLGSPYEISLSEAQQKKSLSVLDSSRGWICIEKIPMDVGRKHFRPAGLESFLGLKLSSTDTKNGEILGNQSTIVNAGDRVVISMDKDELSEMRRMVDIGDDCAVDHHVNHLRSGGVMVELRETKPSPIEAMSNGMSNISSGSDWNEMTIESTWKVYLDEEVRRGAMATERFEPIFNAGLELLQFVEEKTAFEGHPTKLSFQSLTLEGFGPFESEVTYPLGGRGLVLLRGRNDDGGSDR